MGMTMLPEQPRPVLSTGATAAALTLILLLGTSPSLPETWDEPNAIERAGRLQEWCAEWLNPARSPAPWLPEQIARLVPYTTQVEGHPAGYGWVIALGRSLSSGVLPDREASRLGPILLFSLAVGVAAQRMTQEFDRCSAWMFVCCVLSMPRVLAHAHFAGSDGPLAACWLLCWALFPREPTAWGKVLLWGVCVGLCFSMKFSGWLVPWPFLYWSLWRRDLAVLRTVLLGSLIGLLVFIDLNPPVWFDPVRGLQRFWELNLSRAERGLDIPAYFAGEIYTLQNPPPWYHGWAWLILTVSPGVCLLGVWGLTRCWKADSAAGTLSLACWNGITLPIVRSFPGVPGHDAERLLLPGFLFLAIFAGVGANLLWSHAGRGSRTGRARWLRPAVLSALILAVLECGWYSPQWLSYYTPFAGGLSGAVQRGFEGTYYWDSFDQEVTGWLQQHSQPGDRAYLTVSREFVERHNERYAAGYQLTNQQHELPRWHIVQHRPGFWRGRDRLLWETGTPVFEKFIRPPELGCGPWLLNTPILRIYEVSTALPHAQFPQRSEPD